MATDPYDHEPLFELSIVVPQTIYQWLCARADGEFDKSGLRLEPEDVASAEVIHAMKYSLKMAEVDQFEEEMCAALDRGEDVSTMGRWARRNL